MQPVAVEDDVLEASAAGDQRRRDAAGDGVVAEVEMPELAEAAELPRQRAVEAVLREVEPPQVGEVAERRAHLAGDASPGEVQRHDAAAAAPAATPHDTPRHRHSGVDPSPHDARARDGSPPLTSFERHEREAVGVRAGGDITSSSRRRQRQPRRRRRRRMSDEGDGDGEQEALEQCGHCRARARALWRSLTGQLAETRSGKRSGSRHSD